MENNYTVFNLQFTKYKSIGDEHERAYVLYQLQLTSLDGHQEDNSS